MQDQDNEICDNDKIGGITIRYAASRSEGQPYLLLTSPPSMSGLTYRNWWDQLTQSFDVVAVDLPNHGGSDPARHVTTVSEQAAFLGKILDHFELSHPHAVAPDIGTPTLMRFMADNPGRITSATVGDAGVVGKVEGSFLFRTLVYSRLAQWATLSAGGPIGGRIYCAAANSIGYRLQQTVARRKSRLPCRVYTLCQIARASRVSGQLPSAKHPRLKRDVARIDAPVQVLHGEFDTFVSVSNSQRLADLLPNSRFAVIPGAAHYAWEDNPSDYLDKGLELYRRG